MQTWTIKKILDWTTSFFKSKNIPQARLSAELLLSATLNYSRMQLYLNYNYILSPQELKKYKEFIVKRLEHTPVQYILNEAYFRNVKLYVDQNVMIPRPETELVVEKALYCLREVSDVKKSINILEVGVGSGAISISIAKELDNILKDYSRANIISTDSSKKALQVARRNAESILDSKKLSNLKFVHCDIIPQNDSLFYEKYRNNINLVVSNPPYISESDYQNLPREVREFEPKSSLVAGKSGLEVYDKIFSKISPFLAEDICYMVFEIDPKITDALEKLAKEKLAPKGTIIDKDYNRRDRIMTIKL